ncbi:chromate efflux transporter [Thermomicrobium sp. 4228-Ro]|uniref:chromate efflux transporter n=1 Tax=Thermomicrobium sp. 4228-Ro TaxID=2993937 RepID=UPI003A4C6523
MSVSEAPPVRTSLAETDSEQGGHLTEVALVALKLGCLAFGGPAAHIAMLREEVVVRRHWLSEQEFLDLLGITNLIPGPNSTEMVIQCSYRRAGWPGLLVGGILFIFPAAAIVLVLAWLYVRWGTVPAAIWLLEGVKPVLLAIIGQAIWSLGKLAIRRTIRIVLALLVFLLYLAGVHELLLLAGAALAMLVFRIGRRRAESFALAPVGALATSTVPVGSASAPVSLLELFLTLLKIGSVLYGSGYVLLAFLRRDFVERLAWLTDQQLLDAIAVGQVTPGPVFTTATFIGYLVAGLPGALLATIAIFLPAFVFVAVVRPVAPRLRRSSWLASLLDGLNVAAVALMAGVLWELGRTAIGDPLSGFLAIGALVALLRFKVNSAWLIIAGGAIGVATRLV